MKKGFIGKKTFAVLAIFLFLTGALIISSVKFKNNTQKPDDVKTFDQAAIEIVEDSFFPSTITVKNGTAVAWTNKDSKPHQIASDPHPSHTQLPELLSETLSTDDTFTFIFEKAGTYTYHDHFNPVQLKGTIIVE